MTRRATLNPEERFGKGADEQRWPAYWSRCRLGSAITFSAEMHVATDLVVFLTRQPGRSAAIETASAWLDLAPDSGLLEDVLRSLERAGMIAPGAVETGVVVLSEGLADRSLADLAAAVGELSDAGMSPRSELPDPGDADGVLAVVEHEVLAALRDLSLGALAAAPALS